MTSGHSNRPSQKGDREEFVTLLVRKPTMWFPNKSDTNQAIQSQKQARSLKFRRKCTVRVAKTKALISFGVREADLRLCFRMFSHEATVTVVLDANVMNNTDLCFSRRFKTSVYLWESFEIKHPKIKVAV